MEQIEIKEYTGAGYMPVVRYEGWRVAIINYSGIFDKSNFYRVENICSPTKPLFCLKAPRR